MKVTVERTALLKALGHVHRIVERRNTIPILSNVLIEARRGPIDAEGDRPRSRGDRIGAGRCCAWTAPPPCPPMCSTTSSASCRRARRCRWKCPAISASLLLRSGRARFHLQCLPAGDFPDLDDRRTLASVRGRRRSEEADRQHPICDLDRGDPLLSQRHLPACRRGRRRADAAGGRHRRPSARPRRTGRAARRGGHARGDRAAQGGQRNPEADRGSRRRTSRSNCRPPRRVFNLATWS